MVVGTFTVPDVLYSHLVNIFAVGGGDTHDVDPVDRNGRWIQRLRGSEQGDPGNVVNPDHVVTTDAPLVQRGCPDLFFGGRTGGVVSIAKALARHAIIRQVLGQPV